MIAARLTLDLEYDEGIVTFVRDVELPALFVGLRIVGLFPADDDDGFDADWLVIVESAEYDIRDRILSVHVEGPTFDHQETMARACASPWYAGWTLLRKDDMDFDAEGRLTGIRQES